MSNPIIAKTGEDRYCLVKPPDGAKDFQLLTRPGNIDVWKLPESKVVDLYANGILNTPLVPLHLKGNWIIVGIGKDLKEDQWKEIVEESSRLVYKIYGAIALDNGSWLTGTMNPTESGFSWLRSHGADENYLILKEVK